MLKPGSTEARSTNLYRLSDVHALKLRMGRPNKPNPKKKRINNEYRKHSDILSKDDPYGIVIKPKYRDRKCPVCGAPVATGIYACPPCKIVLRNEHSLDVNLEYPTHY